MSTTTDQRDELARALKEAKKVIDGLMLCIKDEAMQQIKGEGMSTTEEIEAIEKDGSWCDVIYNAQPYYDAEKFIEEWKS